MATGNQPSLYERLGGVYAIATVVDDFIDRNRVSPAGFKYLVTEMVCWATGGPQKYTGRTMRESHQALMITAAEWQAFLDDFQQTLDKFSVPQAAQRELKAIVDRGQHPSGYRRVKRRRAGSLRRTIISTRVRSYFPTGDAPLSGSRACP